jgi:cytochrome c oxidase assembly protein subunit 15
LRRPALRKQAILAADKESTGVTRRNDYDDLMPTPAAEPSPFLHRFAWFTAAATLLLICSGGMVTSKGVGLAVPDWPTSFGYNMFFFPVSKWIGGILFEHTHRLLASTIGFLTIILALWLSFSKVERWMKWLGWFSLGAVILQGILGGLRVTLLKDEIGIFHACLAQAFFAMLVIIALTTSAGWRRSSGAQTPKRLLVALAIMICGVIYAQLALGATMRHQHRDLAITDFPLAYGQIIPATDAVTIARIYLARESVAMSEVSAAQMWLQMAHRFLAAIIGLTILTFWLLVRREAAPAPALRKLSTFWLGLVIAQIALGAWTIWSNKAADIATAHVAAGAVIFATGASICAILVRLRQTSDAAVAPASGMNFAEAKVA